MKSLLLGTTRWGLPLLAHRFENHGPEILILGGVHGNEIEGVILANLLLAELLQNFPWKLNLTLIPQMNPEGVLLHQRTNSAGVDLNRNLPTKDWSSQLTNPKYPPGPHASSEPETQALLKFLQQYPAKFILSFHSWKPMINTNGNCQPIDQILHQHSGYVIESDIGYPTPGCLGTYTGLEQNIPTITLEIERGLSAEKIGPLFLQALLKSLQALSDENP